MFACVCARHVCMFVRACVCACATDSVPDFGLVDWRAGIFAVMANAILFAKLL